MKTLVILSHPNLEASNSNREIITALEHTAQTAGWTLSVRHLDRLYPNFQINVAAEQQALQEADLIIFQYPFYWYATPALLKHWMDLVLTWGFAFGEGGDKLLNKFFINSVTVGGAAESYRADSYNHFEIPTFLRSTEQTALLCGMQFAGHLYSHRNFYFPEKWNSRSEVIQTAQEHARQLIEKVGTIVAPEPTIAAFVQNWFSHLDHLDEVGFFLQYLHPEACIEFPEGKYIGPEGFKAWYAGITQKIVAPVQHEVEEIRVQKTGGSQYTLHFPLHVRAQDAQGNTVLDHHLQETWTLDWNPLNARPTITHYVVTRRD